MRIRTPICLLLFLLPLFSIQAHAPNQSYIFLKIYENAVSGRIEITTDDLNKGFDWELKRGKTLEEYQAYIPQLQSYLLKNVSFSSSSGNHPIQFKESSLFVLKKYGDYIQIHFELENIDSLPDTLDIRYNVLFEADATHRGLLVIEHNWKAGVLNNEANVSLIFGPDDNQQELYMAETSMMRGFLAMIHQGMLHIWIGVDHILFLLALMLPSVVRRRRKKSKPDPDSEPEPDTPNALLAFAHSAGTWIPVPKFKPAFIYMIKIVTAFTVAHTITLSLGALDIIEIPGRFIESVIAISIALAAYHNIRPWYKGPDWIMAFGFGLFHGFGFASVLGEIGLTGDYMVYSLLGFNLGVEIGQLAIICLIFPALYFIRNHKSYSRIIVYGSMLLIFISLYWLVERMFDINMTLDDHFINLYIKGLKWIGII
jgi:hypothetical protein